MDPTRGDLMCRNETTGIAPSSLCDTFQDASSSPRCWYLPMELTSPPSFLHFHIKKFSARRVERSVSSRQEENVKLSPCLVLGPFFHVFCLVFTMSFPLSFFNLLFLLSPTVLKSVLSLLHKLWIFPWNPAEIQHTTPR